MAQTPMRGLANPAARSMAWPRVNLLAFHLQLVAAVVLAATALLAPLDTGWSLDVPFATASGAISN